MNNIGVQLGNRLARVGITTRKSAMRLATETGEALTEKINSGKNNLTKEDIAGVIGKVIPKALRPEILTERDEIVPYLVKSGYDETQAKTISNIPYNAMTVPNGNDIPPIYVPLQGNDNDTVPSFSHEIEHSLEDSNRISRNRNKAKGIFRGIYSLLFDRKEKIEKFRMEWHEQLNYMSGQIQILITNIGGMASLLNPNNSTFNCEPNKESFYKLLGLSEKDVKANLHEILQNFVDCDSHGKYNKAVYTFLKWLFSHEIPAYTVGGKIHEKIINAPNTTSEQTARVFLYEDMLDVIKEDRKTYRKNRIRGNLKPQHIYFEDNDIIKLARNEEEKDFLAKLISKARVAHKAQIYKYMLVKPDYAEVLIHNLKNSKLGCIIESDAKKPVYTTALDFISLATPEKIDEFAKIAGEKTADGKYKYQNAALSINHPRFDLIKEIADIEIDGKNPYWEVTGSMILFSEQELEKIYQKISEAAEHGTDIAYVINVIISKKTGKMTPSEILKLMLGA